MTTIIPQRRAGFVVVTNAFFRAPIVETRQGAAGLTGS
jgi:hypothetical protein